ncbi:MAG: Kae1-associated kinase Bud32 [Crenarchaeota archaeon]|nr:Kae1-associated kinase Bud32 [Thermoproteota archaeon]
MEVERLLEKSISLSRITIYSAGKIMEVDAISECRELATGAEARIFKCMFFGIPAVAKIRLPKPFIMPLIDEKLRSRRTRVEARALLDALRLGIPVPRVLWVDVDSGIIIMEFVKGEILRDAINRSCADEACRYLYALGEYLAKLHNAGIVHGDPTTSNLLLSPSGLYLIDFGLAEYTSLIEDYAIDIHIAFRAIESTHFDKESELKECLVKGYSEHMKGAQLVLRKVREIRAMGRYVERRRRSVWGEEDND